MAQLPQNEKQPYRCNSWPQMWPSVLILAMTLTEFSVSNICISLSQERWSDCHGMNNKKQNKQIS